MAFSGMLSRDSLAEVDVELGLDVEVAVAAAPALPNHHAVANCANDSAEGCGVVGALVLTNATEDRMLALSEDAGDSTKL